MQKTVENNNQERIIFIKALEGNLQDGNQMQLKKALLKIDSSLENQQVKFVKGNLRILCNSRDQKAKLMSINKLHQTEVEVSEHNALTRKSGDYEKFHKIIIFGVPKYMDVEYLIEETGATEVKRMLKYDAALDKRVETENVILTYDTIPPTEVYIAYRKYNAKHYDPPPLRCFNCQVYGHTQSVCKSKIKCPRCAGEHKIDDCLVGKGQESDGGSSAGLKCGNCGLNHSSAYRGCEYYLKSKEIMQYKTLHKMSYAEAARNMAREKSNEVGKTILSGTQTLGVSSGGVASGGVMELPGRKDVHIVASVSGIQTNSHIDSSANFRLPTSPSITSTPSRQTKKFALQECSAQNNSFLTTAIDNNSTLDKDHLFVKLLCLIVELARYFLPSDDIIGNLITIIQQIKSKDINLGQSFSKQNLL